MISGFRRDADDDCALLGHYAARCANSLSTFRDNLSVPSSAVEDPNSCPETSARRYHYLLRKSAVLMKLLIMHFSPVSFHFLSFRLKHFLQQSFLRHPHTLRASVGHNLKVPNCRHVCNTNLQTKPPLRHIAVPNSVSLSPNVHTRSPTERRQSLRGCHVDISPSNITIPSALYFPLIYYQTCEDTELCGGSTAAPPQILATNSCLQCEDILGGGVGECRPPRPLHWIHNPHDSRLNL